MSFIGFDEQMQQMKKRDYRIFKSVQNKLKANSSQGEAFRRRVKDINVAMGRRIYFIAEVMQDYLDNIVVREMFERDFSKAQVVSVLQDEEFVAFLIASNLIRRVIDMNCDTRGEVKLRLYVAILNYDSFAKAK